MTDRTVFAGIFLAVVAAAGLAKGIDVAWLSVLLSAGLATIGEELRAFGTWREAPAGRKSKFAGTIFAVASWVAAVAGAAALLIG